MAKRVSVRWFGGAVVLVFSLYAMHSGLGAAPQGDRSSPSPVPLTAEQDHQRLMDLLHIASLRRGADGDPKSPNAANYDEEKAKPDPKLPDPLTNA